MGRIKELFGASARFDAESEGYDEAIGNELVKKWPLTIPKPTKYQGDYVTQKDAFQAWVWNPDKKDYEKHGGSLDPRTGMVLKGRKHKTWDLMENEEKRLNNQIVKKGDRYYSVPKTNKGGRISQLMADEQPAMPVIEQKLQAGTALSRKDMKNLGVSGSTSKQQRQIITDAIARNYGNIGAGTGAQVKRPEEPAPKGPVFNELSGSREQTFFGGKGGKFRGRGAGGTWAGETLEEEIKRKGTILYLLEKLPFSPVRDFEKKGSDEAKSKLRTGKGYGPNAVYTMGGVGFPSYQAPRGPQTVDTLRGAIEEQADLEARGKALGNEIFGSITDLPSYMGEMYAGGIGKVKSIPTAMAFAGKMTVMQPSRIESALARQIDSGEKGAMAIAKAWGDVYIENLSETAGAGFGKVISKLPFGGKLIEGMRKYAKSIGISDNEFWKRVSTQAGYNGFLGEWGEERLGTWLRGLVGINDFGAGKNASIEERIRAGLLQDIEARNAFVEGVTLLAPAAAKYGAQFRENVLDRRSLNKVAKQIGVPIKGLKDEAAAKKVAAVLQDRQKMARTELPEIEEGEEPITKNEREELRQMGFSVAEIGQTPAGELRRRLNKIVNKETLEREGEIRAVSKSDPRLARILAKNLYSGSVDKIIVKELIQNAHDAIMPSIDPTAKNVQVGVDTRQRLIRIEDDGEGMTPEIMQNQFVDKGGSYKKGPSAGGFGIAKFAIFGHAAYITALSTAKVGDKYITTSLEGTGDDWIDENRGLKVQQQEGVFDKTGTTIEIELLPKEEGGIEDFSPTTISEYFSDFKTLSRVPYKTNFIVDGTTIESGVDRVFTAKKLKNKITGKGFSADVYASDELTYSSTSWHYFHVLNRGIYQFSRGFDVPDVKLPMNIIIDVQSDLTPEADNYPFDASREKLKKDTSRAIEEYISENITGELLKKAQETYKTAFRRASLIPGSHSKLVDSSGLISTEKMEQWANTPIYKELAKQMKIAFNDMAKALSDYLPGEMRFHGFVLARDYVGIHINRSYLGEKQNQIMVNISGLWAEIKTDPATYNDVFAGRIVATLLHEIAHQKAGAHMESYAKALTQIIGKTIMQQGKAARALSRAIKGESYETLDTLFRQQYAESIRKDLFGPLASGESIEVSAEGEGADLAKPGEETRPERQKATSLGLESKAGTKVNTEEKEILHSLGLSDEQIKNTPANELKDKISKTNRFRRMAGGFFRLPMETPEPSRLRYGLESWYQDYVNRFASLENLDKKARKLGMIVLPGQKAGLMARLYLGLGMQVESVMKNGTYRDLPNGQKVVTGIGLKPILDGYDMGVKPFEPNRSQRRKDFNTYLRARRTIEDLQREPYEGAGRNIVSDKEVKQAKKELADLKKKYGDKGIAEIERYAQLLYGFQKRVLRMLVDAGNLSQKQYNKIVAQNPHYVSFERIFEKSSYFAGLPRAIFSKARAPFKPIRGTETEIEKADPIEMVIKNTYRIMEAAARNTVARNVARYAAAMPNDVRPVHIKMYPIRVDPDEILTEVKSFKSQASQVVSEAKKIRTEGGEAADISGPAAKLEKVVKDALTHRGFSEGEANSFISQIKKGKPAEGAEKPLHTIEEIQRVVKETVNIMTTETPVETTIFRPSQFMPRGQVIEYFEKGKRKYIEVSDNLYKAMTGLNEEGSSIVTAILSRPAAWLRIGATITPEFVTRNPIRDVWTAFMQTSFGFVPFIDSTRAIADIVGRTDVYYEWLRSGGAYSGFVELSRPALKKAYKELTSSTGREILKRLNPITSAEDLSMLMEQATRLAVYKKALRKGLTPVEAGYASREATVDFGRRGAKMGGVAKTVAFLNAGIQGFDKTIRSSLSNPITTGIKGMMAITLPSLLLYLKNRDDPEYKQIPQWQKDLFWLFKVNDTWVRVPKPFVFGQMFGSVPERFFEYLDTKDPKAFDGLVTSVIKSSSPVGLNPVEALIPTAVKPIIENMTNYNFFRERSIVPKSVENLSRPEQFSRYTTESAKYLGKWLNYSPAKIENAFYGYTGGTGRYVLEGTDFLVRNIKGEKRTGRPKELSDYPLVRGFVTRPAIGPSAESITDFYNLSEPIIANRRSFTDSISRGNEKRAQEILEKHPEISIAPDLIKTQTAMSQINRLIDMVADSDMPVDQKRELIKERDQQRVDMARQANKLIEEIIKKK